jgi:hypothetical protein
MPLANALTSSDFMTQRYAALGIANLATNLSNQVSPTPLAPQSVPKWRVFLYLFFTSGFCVVPPRPAEP